jgi:hypothetical protein
VSPFNLYGEGRCQHSVSFVRPIDWGKRAAVPDSRQPSFEGGAALNSICRLTFRLIFVIRWAAIPLRYICSRKTRHHSLSLLPYEYKVKQVRTPLPSIGYLVESRQKRRGQRRCEQLRRPSNLQLNRKRRVPLPAFRCTPRAEHGRASLAGQLWS